MDQVASGECGMTLGKRPREADVLRLDTPDLLRAALDQREGMIDLRAAGDSQIRMEQFLHDLCRRDEHAVLLEDAEEEIASGLAERMRAADRVHEDVGVDEDHVTSKPAVRDRSIRRRCSSQSGSRSSA